MSRPKRRPEFENALPSISAEERKAMVELAKERGIVYPALTWNGTLIDGHHREGVAAELGIDCPTVEMEFESEEEVQLFIARMQLARRNMNKHSFKLVLARTYELTKKLRHDDEPDEPEEPAAEDNGNKPKKKAKGSTRSQVAKEYSVSEGTVQNAVEYAADYDNLGAVAKKFADNNPKQMSSRVIKTLAKLPKADQTKAVQKVKTGSAPSLRDALGIKVQKAGPKPAKKTVKQTFDPIFDDFNKLQRKLEKLMLERGGQGANWHACDKALEELHVAITGWSEGDADAK